MINTIIYVSCNPESMVENALVLCAPSSQKFNYSKPFSFVKSISVDMFPHTKHWFFILLIF
jgi:tRNA (uracil-5-)-methyltransferase